VSPASLIEYHPKESALCEYITIYDEKWQLTPAIGLKPLTTRQTACGTLQVIMVYLPMIITTQLQISEIHG
jgi:hypothetical protein